MGVINSTRSVINRSENLYSPVEDSIFSLFDDDSDLRLKILDHRLYPSRKVLEDLTIAAQNLEDYLTENIIENEKHAKIRTRVMKAQQTRINHALEAARLIPVSVD
jgi:hypothetical protein